MNRRHIFAGIAALWGGVRVARGQSAVVVNPPEECKTCVPPVFPSDKIQHNLWQGKPEPDQCPVCGTMAELYVRKTEAQHYPSWACLSLPASPDGNAYAACRAPSETALVGPMERITKCQQCSAAFWQTAKQ